MKLRDEREVGGRLNKYDTVLMADSGEDLQQVANEFVRVCDRMKLKCDVRKSKVSVNFRKRSGNGWREDSGGRGGNGRDQET